MPLPAEEVALLLAGRHPDPFAALGPHGGEHRALLPGAEAAWALAGGVAHPLAPRAPGFFEGPAPPTRRLRIRWPDAGQEVEDPYAFGPALGALDEHLLLEGTHTALHRRLGAHPVLHEGAAGLRFAVWAPHARRVSVVGGWNGWDGRRHPMRRRLDSGVWEIFLPGLAPGEPYKFELLGPDGRLLPLKADPFAAAAELRPATASVAAAPRHEWRHAPPPPAGPATPLSIYEVHAPSWKRHPDGRFWDWDELAAGLLPYVAGMGFTHVELMPVMEHPLDASWGYQVTGFFAPTARLGDPAGLRRFVDAAHGLGLGVILDWVPGHFPRDAHGLARFDGAPLFEHPDPRRGLHPDWGTAVFDHGRAEVRAFLRSSAAFWLEDCRADGLRVDAVSSMIRLDYSRGPGEWAPNADGGAENADAVRFLHELHAGLPPGKLSIAEEATDRPGVTAPPEEGGLGFGFKWNMGWMNDTLRYLALDPVHRRWHHGLVTFGLVYAWNERFVLPLSHDEVVHGKGSLLGRIPGTDAERFATLRAFYAFMWGHPGKKLLFMGGEIAQWREWSEARELDWWLLEHAPHRGVQELVRELNRLHRAHPALHALDCAPEGFAWIEPDDAERSVFSWRRRGGDGVPEVLVLVNFTPVRREAVPIPPGRWRVLLDTGAARWGGAGEAVGLSAAAVDLPGLCALYLEEEETGDA
ncbi:1,4-alpha-glucan branching protein GlgB [Roseococcus sp. DSY-14]|uniref:1,4-alpha-glucan branching protein GlgB n=1 Tax=Roseococcus sp. DSY-14 TaxID=3369650 RepID=UPI00387B83D6